MEVIEKLNTEFSDLQAKYFELETKYHRLLFNRCLMQFRHDYVLHHFKDSFLLTGSLYDEIWDEDDFLCDTNDRTTTMLTELYNFHERTCDCWYRTDKEFPCVPWHATIDSTNLPLAYHCVDKNELIEGYTAKHWNYVSHESMREMGAQTSALYRGFTPHEVRKFGLIMRLEELLL
jgi:hypothetical protein